MGLAVAVLGVGSRLTLTLGAGLTLALVAVVAAVGPRRGDMVPLLVITCALAAGLGLGALRVQALSSSPMAEGVGRLVAVEVVLQDGLVERGRYLSGPARVTGRNGQPWAGGGVWLQVAIPFSGGGEERDAVAAELGAGRGDVLCVEGRVGIPIARGSGFDQAAYLRRQGIAVTLTAAVGDVQLTGHRGGIAGWIDHLRLRMCANLRLGIPSTHAGVLQGILLGLKQGIPDGTMEAFRRAGLAHLLTVSGSHIAWLLVLMTALGRALRLSRTVALVLSLVLLMLFVPLTDESPSVVRAGVAGGLLVACRLSGRRRDTWQVVLMSATMLLASNPFMIMSPGFQLSFAAVVGIVCWAGPIAARLSRLPPLLAEAAAVTLAASAATLPVSLLQFGEASLSSLPANLAVGPLVPLVTGMALLGSLSGLAATWCAVLFNFPAAVLVEWTCRVASVAARAPALGRGAVGPLAAAAVAAAAAWLVMRRRAAGRPAPPSAGVCLSVVAAAGLAGALLFFPAVSIYDAAELWRARLAWPAGGEIRVLDVGQGSATLVRTPHGHAVLIDAGPPEQGLVHQLRALGVDRVDLVIISHAHEDHFGGLGEMAGTIAVGAILDTVTHVAVSPGSAEGGLLAGKGEEAELVSYLEARKSLVSPEEVGHPPSGTEMNVDGALLRFMGATSAEGTASEDVNALSLVVEVCLGGVAILVPGDAEAQYLEAMELNAVDVLAVAHHGSKGAVSDELLQELRLGLAVISVGRDNRFGHPHAETMLSLDRAHIPALRTDECGWVALRPAGQGVDVVVEKSPLMAEVAR